MLEKEQYIWKAKHQRGLTDEQIQYFLDRDIRYDLMPYYSLCCKRYGCEQGYAEVVKLYGESPAHDALKEIIIPCRQEPISAEELHNLLGPNALDIINKK